MPDDVAAQQGKRIELTVTNMQELDQALTAKVNEARAVVAARTRARHTAGVRRHRAAAAA